MPSEFDELVADLASLNVRIRLSTSGELLVDALPGTIDTALKERIAANKPHLLRMLAMHAEASDAAQIAPISTRDSEFPASYSQESLWLHEQLSGKDSYNVSFVLRVRGTLDAHVLRLAFRSVVRRHEVLRTTFRFDGFRLTQRLSADIEQDFVIRDLVHLGEVEQKRALDDALSRLAREPFDLETGPMHRCGLFRLSESVHAFTLVLHHMVFDHWSRGPLARDLVAFYSALSAGDPVSLPVLPVQYRDYAAWQRRRLEGAYGQRLLAYWTETLRDAPPLLRLPTDRSRRSFDTFSADRVLFSLDGDRTGALGALARREGTSLFMLLEAAFAVLMYRYTGQDDLCVGTPVAGRSRSELEGLVGLFVNTLVLRTRVVGDEPFIHFLIKVRDVVLQAFSHQEFPFDQLVQELKPIRSAGVTPLFQVLFALQNTPVESLQAAGLTFDLLPSPTRSAKFDLAWTFTEHGGKLFGKIEYNTDLFDEATVQRMARHYEVLLEGICADPQAKVSDLPLLAAQERHQILVEW
ncbi:MAG: Long-chain-fatty-acid--CoA ligase, partial [Pseudomonadota bacterium]